MAVSKLKNSYTKQIRRYREEIIKSVNRVQLVPKLIEEDLIQDEDLFDDQQWHRFIDLLNERQSRKFIQCVQKAKEHMGHAYICALMEGKPLADDDKIQASREIRDRIRKNMSQLVSGLNLTILAPIMYAKGLLTSDEFEDIHQNRVTQPRGQRIIHFFQKVLVTKGPLAHGLFAECLAEETQHRAHGQLFRTITGTGKRKHEELDDSETDGVELVLATLEKRTPCTLEMQEPLGGDEYTEMIKRFQTHYQNGMWKQLNNEVEHYKTCSIIELQVMAFQEKAMGCIYRREWKGALSNFRAAKSRCKQITIKENSKYLLGRCENIKSTFYRYHEQYDKARKHVEKAKVHLFYLKREGDYAMTAYLEACIGAECCDRPKEETIEKFKLAVGICRGSTDNTVKLLRSHAPIQLAEVHLGATRYTPGTTTNPENISDARNCLEAVNVDDLPVRHRTHYYIAKSDFHRCTSNGEEARMWASKALQVAEENNFATEIHSAKARLKSLFTSSV